MVNYTSIIMLHYRKNRVRLDLARESIDSLLQNTTAPYELIFEDNTQNNRYFEARNAGVARAKGKYLAFVDDDIKFLPGWLEECIEILQRGGDWIVQKDMKHVRQGKRKDLLWRIIHAGLIKKCVL